jgi:8-oxo-dGTP pyrophosphatase MutT (NUDIX family)
MVYVENLGGGKVWTFPKGHPEKGETDEQAAVREVREETGWDTAVGKPLMDVHYFYTHKNIRYNKTVRWFVMSPVSKVGSFQEEEILDCRWANLKEAKSLVSYESDKTLLTKLESVL